MSDKATQKGLRNELGDGYLNLLDSVRHSFEQAAWGQETSGSLAADDFYRWAGTAEGTPQPTQATELGEGVQVEASAERNALPDRDWNEFEAWIEGKREAMSERDIAVEHERNGPELGE